MLAGTATGSGRGDNGIQMVTVNGVRANNDMATGNGTANWSKALTLQPGTNPVTVVGYDNNFNVTTKTISLYVVLPISGIIFMLLAE